MQKVLLRNMHPFEVHESLQRCGEYFAQTDRAKMKPNTHNKTFLSSVLRVLKNVIGSVSTGSAVSSAEHHATDCLVGNVAQSYFLVAINAPVSAGKDALLPKTVSCAATKRRRKELLT